MSLDSRNKSVKNKFQKSFDIKEENELLKFLYQTFERIIK